MHVATDVTPDRRTGFLEALQRGISSRPTAAAGAAPADALYYVVGWTE